MRDIANHFPRILAAYPASSAFWVLCATLLFQVLALILVAPGLALLLDRGTESLQVFWLTLCCAGAVQFAALSAWNQAIGAGSFAGPLTPSANWLIAAIGLGPLCLLIPSFAFALFFPSEAGWEYADGVDPSVFEPENWAAGFLLYVLLVAPIVEEITFRGVALAALIGRGVPVVAACLLSSAAFAAFHSQYSFAALMVVFIAGLGFCAIRIASGSMLSVIVAHISANAVMLALQAG